MVCKTITRESLIFYYPKIVSLILHVKSGALCSRIIFIHFTAWTENELRVVKEVNRDSRRLTFKVKCQEAALRLPGRN